MKTCKKCLKELDKTQFSYRKQNKDGLHIYCKQCCLKSRKQYDEKIGYKNRKNRYHNDEEFRKKMIKWNTKPIGSRIEYSKRYYQNNKEKMKENVRKYRNKNRDALNAWCRKYYKDPAKRIARSMYNRVLVAIFSQLANKSQKTELLCGCTWEELVQHLEKQFRPGMSWDTYGFGEGKWSIDHIIPCNRFDLTDLLQQQKCFHYTNLQPLWSSENSAKHDNISV
jgi:hypothetical protein